MNKTFIFDLDDTLIRNHHKYSFTQMELARHIINRLGLRAPELQAIIDLQVDIDKKRVVKQGFSRDRFPEACEETYRKIAESLGEVDEEGAEQALRIGYGVFDEKKWKELGIGDLVSGAKETLDFLVEQQDELLLMTKGDVNAQAEKIQLNSLEKYFGPIVGGGIYIVEKKTPEIVSSAVGARDKERVWHVGNLIKSDVIPALSAGIKVIYIPCETWAFEKEHSGLESLDTTNLTTFNTILDIKRNYSSLK
jgi:putative hydrolase of the HAD superfamily